MATNGHPNHFYYPTLDGWRALAILGVIVCHSADRLFHSAGSFPHAFLYDLTRKGAWGVDLFFSISGFLITSRLIELHALTGKSDLPGFYIRRFFRIIPPYFTYLLILSLAYFFSLTPMDKNELISSVFFVRNYYPDAGQSTHYTDHLWSIAIEEHFYIIFPSLLFLLGPKNRKTILTLFAACITIAVWRWVDFRHHFFDSVFPGIGFHTRTDTRIDGLLWGCIYSLLFHIPVFRDRLEQLISPFVWWILFAGWFGILYFHPPLFNVLVPFLTPLLIIGTVIHFHRRPAKILESGPFRYVGRISYSLYLWNNFFMPGMETEAFAYGLSVVQKFPLHWFFTFLFSDLSYRWIEKPFIRLGYHFAPAPKPER